MADAPEDWPLNLADLEAPAAELLDRDAYDYYRSGGGDEITLGRNRAAFDEIRLLPHVLRNVSEISLERTLLGSPSSMPIAVANMLVALSLVNDEYIDGNPDTAIVALTDPSAGSIR